MAYENDIPIEIARRAHGFTSFVPEQRGDQERAGYAAQLEADHAALAKYADTDEKKATLETEFARYRAGYRDKTIAYLSSRGRCASIMITGGSNFPTRRNEKANNSADRRLEELVEFRKRALAAIHKILTPELQPIKSGDADAIERLETKIAEAEALQAKMKAANAAIRKSAKAGKEAQIQALATLGLPAKLLEPDFCGRIGFAQFELTNNNANIRRMKERLEGLRRTKAEPETATEGENGVRVEDSPAENRVRLFFPGKPDVDVRTKLKANGFRWAPSQGCWNGYRNSRTLELAASFKK